MATCRSNRRSARKAGAGTPTSRRLRFSPRSCWQVSLRRWQRSSSPPPRGGREKLFIHVRHLDAERGWQIDLVILLLHQDFADLLSHGEFAERLALPDTVAVIANGFVFVVEIEPQHVLGIFRGLDRLRRNGRHRA